MTTGASQAAASADYPRSGYRLLENFVPPEVARGFLARLKPDLARNGTSLDTLRKEQPLLRQPAAELYGYHYPPLATFHWGMTPAMEALVGEPLLPTYAYFRLYRQGDICRVHGDRYSCEHSLSLTMAYADDEPWPLEVGHDRIDEPYARAEDCWRDREGHTPVPMKTGDAVLYQGVHHHHGRTSPNPNRWSAHVFAHWVARDGPYAETAFDGHKPPEAINF